MFPAESPRVLLIAELDDAGTLLPSPNLRDTMLLLSRSPPCRGTTPSLTSRASPFPPGSATSSQAFDPTLLVEGKNCMNTTQLPTETQIGWVSMVALAF
jgi:hypothetical protein